MVDTEPQQPHEDPDWVYNEVNGWLFGPDPDNPRLRYPFLFGADPEQCRTLAAYLNDTRPAAPSAQPDEACGRCEHRRGDHPNAQCWMPGCRCLAYRTPAQSVRDTEEGRR